MSNSNGFRQTKPAVFLDRDGTINVEKEYLYRPQDFEFTPRAIEAIRMLNQAGYLVVVVTNQSGVARGYYSEEAVRALHVHVAQLLAADGARVDGWYYCPHHPGGKAPYDLVCSCRKPLPGMLMAATEELGIDLGRSWMVGDKLADIEAGIAAGCRPILVLTGYGDQDQASVDDTVLRCTDLYEAACKICAV